VTWPGRPTIHEINTWPWLDELSRAVGRQLMLSDVTAEAWDALCLPGIDAVWLMGVWERSPASRTEALSDQANVDSFRQALPDLDIDRDIIGSAYSVRRYVVDEHLGGPAALAVARRELDQRGVRLLLDFVPNHVAPDHPWAGEHPEYFVHDDDGGLAHGRDPYFPPWADTLQLNAFSMPLRRAAADTLVSIAKQCDGVRCDMAMLLLNHVFAQTWGARVGWAPPGEYWTQVIGAARAAHPGFVLMAEAYWDLEYELQQLGFDFCYDKRLYDRLVEREPQAVRAHVSGDPTYQERLVRFIENHDEPRAAATFGPEDERAAAVVAATLPGATLWYEGQFDGRRVRPPVFLARRPEEPSDLALNAFYSTLVAADVRRGAWDLLACEGWPDNNSAERLLAWSWTDGDARTLIVVNGSDGPAQGRVRLAWGDLAGRSWSFTDVLDGTCFVRDGDELAREGLYVDRPGGGVHVLQVRTA
jgi:hypothetical protein